MIYGLLAHHSCSSSRTNLFLNNNIIYLDDIHIEKKIPMQAGMGGGSSDAAAVLRGLRQIYAPNMTMRELERISIRLGSDVPYCVAGCTTLVRGRGEQLQKISALPECWFIHCKPEESYSTAAMYHRIDEDEIFRVIMSDLQPLLEQVQKMKSELL